MVYILVANKLYKYQDGRSRIIYIGTTGKGAGRPATSAVDKASQAFRELRGVKQIEVHIVTCRGRKGIQRPWEHLESALLGTFRGRYFQLPRYNKKKGSVRHPEDVKLFRQQALLKLILQFAELAPKKVPAKVAREKAGANKHVLPKPDSVFEVTLRGRSYTMKVEKKDGELVYIVGRKTFHSPSGAGESVTGMPCNGWKFWHMD